MKISDFAERFIWRVPVTKIVGRLALISGIAVSIALWPILGWFAFAGGIAVIFALSAIIFTIVTVMDGFDQMNTVMGMEYNPRSTISQKSPPWLI